MKSSCHKEVPHNTLSNCYGFVYVYAHEGAKGTNDLIVQRTISVETNSDVNDIEAFLCSLGYETFHYKKDINFDEKEQTINYYVDDEGVAIIRMHKSPNSFCFFNIYCPPKKDEDVDDNTASLKLALHIAGSSPDILQDIEKIVSFLEKIKFIPKKIGEIYTIGSNSNGLYFSKMGSEGEDYIKSNYSADHASAREYILQQLRAKKPNGRLNVFFGPPGTGKTHFIKSLLGHVDSSIFVYVPPHLVPQISNPSFVTAIIERREAYPNEKIIFVLEDADQVLATRMADNMSDINGLLNLTDGFLASSFDIRIIATTNSKAEDIDPAILRPGRLCAKLNFSHLNREEAENCYRNLTNGKELSEVSSKQEMTLAEIYSLAVEVNTPGILSNSKKTKSFGF